MMCTRSTIAAVACALLAAAHGCTNILVSKGASSDGSTHVGEPWPPQQRAAQAPHGAGRNLSVEDVPQHPDPSLAHLPCFGAAYNADSGNLYGSLGHYPAADHAAGTKRDIWDWDGSFYLGSIPEVNHTYVRVKKTHTGCAVRPRPRPSSCRAATCVSNSRGSRRMAGRNPLLSHGGAT